MNKEGTHAPQDPRAIANFILDACESIGITVTNLKLQKLMYFCHAMVLVKTGQPLMNPGFQAWRYGPVNKLVYSIFKVFGEQPITERATKLIIETGNTEICTNNLSTQTKAHISECLTIYGNISTGQLVKLTHIIDGPWYQIWETNKDKVNLGLAISDNVIKSHFLPKTLN